MNRHREAPSRSKHFLYSLKIHHRVFDCVIYAPRKDERLEAIQRVRSEFSISHIGLIRRIRLFLRPFR